MTVRYLLDTNALSEPASPVKNLSFMRRMSQALGQMATSATTISEIRFGLDILPEGRRRESLEAYYEGILRSIPVLPFDGPTAQVHGKVRAQLQKAGRAAPFADSMIAAVVLSHGLTLVTANTRDFVNIPGLQVEDWTTPPEVPR